jgi:cysteinyl-tRNA synthetase
MRKLQIWSSLPWTNLIDALNEQIRGFTMWPRSINKTKSSLDFILWNQCQPGEPGWPSPWGLGRPGWGAQCAAMTCHDLP